MTSLQRETDLSAAISKNKNSFQKKLDKIVIPLYFLALIIVHIFYANRDNPFLNYFNALPLSLRIVFPILLIFVMIAWVNSFAWSLILRFTDLIRKFFINKTYLFLIASMLFFFPFFFLRAKRNLGDGNLLMRLVSGGYKFDPHSPINKYFQNFFLNLTQKYFAWDISLSWAITSVMLGIIFIFFLLLLTHKLFKKSSERIIFLFSTVSIGSVQLFFGYIEDYPLVLATLMIYIYVSYKYLRGELSIFWPSMLMSILLGASLLTGWLLPSVFYLYFSKEIKFEKKSLKFKKRNLLLFLAGLILPYSAIMVFFALQKVDLINLFRNSHLVAAMKPNIKYFLSLKEMFSITHITDFVLEHLLISSYGLFLLFYLLISKFKKITFDKFVIFLMIASGGLIIFSFVWIPQLGAFMDWDLFAVSSLPYSVLAIYLFLKTKNTGFKYTGMILIIGNFMITIPWFLSNAFPTK